MKIMDTGKYHLLGNREHNLPHALMIVLPQKYIFIPPRGQL